MAVSSSSACSHCHALDITRALSASKSQGITAARSLLPRKNGVYTLVTMIAVTGTGHASIKHSKILTKSPENYHTRWGSQSNQRLSCGTLHSVVLMASTQPDGAGESHRDGAVNTYQAEEGGGDEDEEGDSNEEGKGRTAKRCTFEDEVVEEFVRLNDGDWHGNFLHFDFNGSLLHKVSTRLSARAFGRGAYSSLQQTLHILQSPQESARQEQEGPVWVPHKMDELNQTTLANRYQAAFFGPHSAFSCAHLTAEPLVKAVLVGVLGEGEVEEDGESCNNSSKHKVPSHRPALVSEACLFADICADVAHPPSPSPSPSPLHRVRAFHVLDSRGVIDSLALFCESKQQQHGDQQQGSASLRDVMLLPDSSSSRLQLLLGEWRGTAVTHRSALYGSSCVEESTRCCYELKGDGTLVLVESRGGNTISTIASIAEDSSCLHFNTGRQQTLLPAGLSLSYPSLVPRGRAFSFELSWIAMLPNSNSDARSDNTDSDECTDTGTHDGCLRSRVMFPISHDQSPFPPTSNTASTASNTHAGSSYEEGGRGGEGRVGQEGRVERQRLLRTYDADGLVVSTTLIREVKVAGRSRQER